MSSRSDAPVFSGCNFTAIAGCAGCWLARYALRRHAGRLQYPRAERRDGEGVQRERDSVTLATLHDG